MITPKKRQIIKSWHRHKRNLMWKKSNRTWEKKFFSISVKADPFLLRLGKKKNPIKLSATTGAVNAMLALATDFSPEHILFP
jgi:hypothetical protein